MSITIRNLLDRELPLLRRVLKPRESVEVDDAEAAELAGHPHLDGPPPIQPTPEIQVAGGTPKTRAKAKEATK